MSWCPIKDTKSYIVELTTDDSGRKSLSKTITFWAFIFSTLFCWKLIIMGGFGVEYFTAYLASAAGHGLLSKFLDGKAGKDASGS